MKPRKYLDVITAAFAAVLILSNITSTKILSLGWFSFDGGTILFPLAYIFGDVLTEVYGYARARRVIWIGFGMNLLMVLTLWVVKLLPPDASWGLQDAYESILGTIPRIVLASLIAYVFGEFLNSFVLAKMKIRSGGKSFWQRALGSTVVGQFADTTLFTLIAFAGALPIAAVWAIWYTNYLFKILVEVALLPVTYRVVNFLKKKEQEDTFDTHTDFHPLHTQTS